MDVSVSKSRVCLNIKLFCHTVNIAEAASLALLGMVKTTRPVHGHIAFITVETRSAFHASTCADTAKLEKPIKYWTVVPDIIPSLFLSVVFHVVGCNFREEIDVFIGVKLCHLKLAGRFCALEKCVSFMRRKRRIEKAAKQLT